MVEWKRWVIATLYLIRIVILITLPSSKAKYLVQPETILPATQESKPITPLLHSLEQRLTIMERNNQRMIQKAERIDNLLEDL